MKPLLILDLDETLIYSSEHPLQSISYTQIGEYFTYSRPYIEEFFHGIKAIFDIGIWSSSSDKYAHAVVSTVLPKCFAPVFVYGRSKCTQAFDHYRGNVVFKKKLIKLKKKGYSLEKMLIVDDSPEKVKDNYGNAIYVKEWTGDQNDKELQYLKIYLQKISNEENFRTIEKRFWRREINENCA
ncbi:HAD family hydrolase [Leptospira kmetyi]|uniref:HAD family hydrolase n=1 Tax=Leptospira kmetyi TaxID=408139 RepID=UPI003EBD6A24